jgi:hypothetical protein
MEIHWPFRTARRVVGGVINPTSGCALECIQLKLRGNEANVGLFSMKTKTSALFFKRGG